MPDCTACGSGAGERKSPMEHAHASRDDTAIDDGKTPATHATGIYRARACTLHQMGRSHPESPARLFAIDDQLIASGLDQALVHHDAPLADADDLLRVHPRDYLDHLEAKAPVAGYVSLDADTLMGPQTMDAVRYAAGAAVAATDAVFAGELKNAFCAIRPPGHHAGIASAMGFCFVNNVAVAARRALDVHGLERVAIVDFDVHHGNGTEEIFAGDARVLMVGLFQHPFYPYSGSPPAAANMINVPLPAGADGEAVRAAVQRQWLPALEAFKPQMIFISAGFDAHREDDLGQMRLVEADYVWLTREIQAVAARHAKGRIVSCLEGGYNLSALGRSVVAHVRTLAEV
jgi:acetoin utilization deacetylase AcuC-like enzyme